MKVLSQNLVFEMVSSSEKISQIKQAEGYYRYQIEKERELYFKLKVFPKIPKNNLEEAKENLENITKEYQRQFQFVQLKLSSYILKYEQVLFSYPYACFTHTSLERSVSDFIKSKASDQARLNLTVAIAQGIIDLHQKDIYIMSLKPQTILILKQTHKQFKIAFSEIKYYQNLNTQQGDLIKYEIQNNFYSAPQIQQGQLYSPYCDIWSFGLIIYEILTGKKFNKHSFQLTKKIIFPAPQQGFVSSWQQNLLSKMIAQSPKDRYQIKDVAMILNNAKLCSDSSYARKIYSRQKQLSKST